MTRHTPSEQHVSESIGSRVRSGSDDHDLTGAISHRAFEHLVIVEILHPQAADSVAGDISVRFAPRVGIEQAPNLGIGIAPRACSYVF